MSLVYFFPTTILHYVSEFFYVNNRNTFNKKVAIGKDGRFDMMMPERVCSKKAVSRVYFLMPGAQAEPPQNSLKFIP